MSNLIFTTDAAAALASLCDKQRPGGVVVVCDANTAALVYPTVKASLPPHTLVTIEPGDVNKTVAALTEVWHAFSASGLTRSGLVVNIGGGMVTDLGGFAAATFKRGVDFVNVPTTLLAAVDASVGGKTGVNLDGLKNEVGAFREASSVIISPEFYATLPPAELWNGYAEMLKHGLLDSPAHAASILALDPAATTPAEMAAAVKRSVAVKKRIVEADPTERGLRKVLNLGHTAGHAFETLAMMRERPVGHGTAVAWGLVTAAVLSHINLGFPSGLLHAVALRVKEGYPTPWFGCRDYDTLLALMSHDKKNTSPDAINFTLLSDAGSPLPDVTTDRDGIVTALDITLDLLA